MKLLRRFVVVPFVFAAIVFITGTFISLVLARIVEDTLLMPFIEGFSGSFIASFIYWEVPLVLYGNSPFAVFLRSFGAGFTSSFTIDVSWMSEEAFTVPIDLVINAVYLMFIPLLSIMAARLATRKFAGEYEPKTAAFFNSLWLAAIGAFCAVISAVSDRKIFGETFFIVGAYYPILSATGMTFTVSLLIQLLFEYRGSRASDGDAGKSVLTDCGITHGLEPVKWLLYVTPAVLLVLFILFAAGGGSMQDFDEYLGFSDGDLFAAATPLILLLGLLLWTACFIFGMPLEISYIMPMDGVSETIRISIFNITAGASRASLPLTAAVSIVISLALLVIVFGSIRNKHSGKAYWFSGGIAMAVHLAFLLLIARFSAYSLNFAPSPDTAHALRLMSSDPGNLFLGMHPNFYWMLCFTGTVYALFGFLGDEGGAPAKLSRVLLEHKVSVLLSGAALFAVALYVSMGAVVNTTDAHFAAEPYNLADVLAMFNYYMGDLLFIIEHMR